MPAESAFAVLHITAAAGGGADRYIRDLARSTPHRHHVLHVGSGIAVLEDIAAGRFVPLRDITSAGSDGAALARWMRLSAIGILHLHGVDAAIRAHLAALTEASPLPYLLTLHDLQFVNSRAFDATGMPSPEPDWIREICPTLERAATVIVPSTFILDVALSCAPGICAVVIPPGVLASAPAEVAVLSEDYKAQSPRHVAAIVGAVGPHKGSGMLAALGDALRGSDIGIVVIGYTDSRLDRGWLDPGVIYVHGAYQDATLTAWLAAYGVDTVLFPNRLPESFSYTLSEVWAAGLPVIVPDQGALGDRVEESGGGWLLPAGFDGEEAAALLVWLYSAEGAADRARVKSRIVPGDADRIPPLEAMSRDVDALYQRFGLPSPEAADAAAGQALAPLAAANLDGFAFRKELVHLSRDLAELQRRLAESTQWNEKLERDSIAWAAKLEADIAALKKEIERLGAETRGLTDYKAAFDRLPSVARRYLLSRALRARR